MIRTTVVSAIFAVAASLSQADEFGPALEAYLADVVSGYTSDSVLVEAIRQQNQVTGGYDNARILELDQAWRAEVGASSTPTISPVMENAASDYLRDVVENAGGTITEIFIMDAQGLNVAASSVTSDYWQGDEDKFSMTYLNGAGSSHIGEVEFDDSTQSFQSQISVAIVDPTSQQPVGAMTVGINAEALF